MIGSLIRPCHRSHVTDSLRPREAFFLPKQESCYAAIASGAIFIRFGLYSSPLIRSLRSRIALPRLTAHSVIPLLMELLNQIFRMEYRGF
ncbi:MAG: hypothetical protein CO093_05385 [Alphaproteobacteria bacterium CG_4_9_14_3_um_filter_47_13]|nr:MAG: hypothetical protein CO093_05385 [Alphaproteobacteria bacterium CG_4_9_14_3_um_filter_47_13]